VWEDEIMAREARRFDGRVISWCRRDHDGDRGVQEPTRRMTVAVVLTILLAAVVLLVT
jgi:hypothetical protein